MCVQLVAEGPSRQRCSFHLGVGGCHGDVTSRLKVATGRGKGEEREVASLGSEDLLGGAAARPLPLLSMARSTHCGLPGGLAGVPLGLKVPRHTEQTGGVRSQDPVYSPEGPGATGHGGRAGLARFPGRFAQRLPKRLSSRAGTSTCARLLRGPAALLPGGSCDPGLCQGGTLHSIDWQQVTVSWVPCTVLLMGWQVSVHHVE